MQLSLLRELRGFISDRVWKDVCLGDHLNMEGWALNLDQDLVVACFYREFFSGLHMHAPILIHHVPLAREFQWVA